MMKRFLPKSHAFSLVELLVVIAVIAIVAAIAIPNIAGITNTANDSKSRRNAQNISSVFGAARAAGLTNSIADTAEAIDLMREGATVDFLGVPSSFRVDGLTAAEAIAAEDYLDYVGDPTNGRLRYMGSTN
jgi:type IV pilus assembly protein PilA